MVERRASLNLVISTINIWKVSCTLSSKQRSTGVGCHDLSPRLGLSSFVAMWQGTPSRTELTQSIRFEVRLSEPSWIHFPNLGKIINGSQL